MATITAQAFPNGVTADGDPASLTTREITEDLPSDVIGECVTECTHKAWSAGNDPALEPFVIIVTYR